MKRRIKSRDELIDLIRSRATKGDAFRYSSQEYKARQEAILAELHALSDAEIRERFARYLYDVK